MAKVLDIVCVTLACVMLLATPGLASWEAAAQKAKGFYPDEIVYFEVTDEDLAISQVKDGVMDIYLWRLPAAKAAETLKDPRVASVRAASSYDGFLYNTATVEGKLNPFSVKEFRQIVSWHLIDRDFIVKEVLKGLGEAVVATMGPYHPDYVYIIDIVEPLKARIRYDPIYAGEQINDIMMKEGATKREGKWLFRGEPIKLKLFIRVDDPVRKAIGDKFALDLEALGFTVERIYGDLRKARATVHGSDPAALEWHLYTEGWSFTAITKYDDSNAAFFYAPWAANMPGWGQPGYWQYEHPLLDDLTRRLYEAKYKDLDERATLLRKSFEKGLDESVRAFINLELTNFVYNKDRVEKFAYDLFGGPFTYWFYRTVKLKDPPLGGTLKVGQKLMYQGAYNPVRGFADVYGVNVLRAISDPSAWPHPHTGLYHPNRVTWKVETAGPEGKVSVPADALKVDLNSKAFVKVGPGVNATSKVIYTVKMGNFHHGQPMTVADLVEPFYFMVEWGTENFPGDPQFDGEYSRASTAERESFVGFRVVGDNVVEVYFNYWHPDESYTGTWLTAYSSTPWELSSVLEDVVASKKAAFSAPAATAQRVEWLDVTKGPSLDFLKESLAKLSKENFIPNYLKPYVTPEEASKRWGALSKWVDTYGHFLVSNGPYFFYKSDVAARQDIVRAFRDPTYPFSPGDYDYLVAPKFAEVVKIDLPLSIVAGEEAQVKIQVNVAGTPSSRADVIFMLFTLEGKVALKGSAQPTDRAGEFTVKLGAAETSKLDVGAYTIRAIATAYEAARPSTMSAALAVTPAFQAVRGEMVATEKRLTEKIAEIDKRVAEVIAGIDKRIAGVESGVAKGLADLEKSVVASAGGLEKKIVGVEGTVSDARKTLDEKMVDVKSDLGKRIETVSSDLTKRIDATTLNLSGVVGLIYTTLALLVVAIVVGVLSIALTLRRPRGG